MDPDWNSASFAPGTMECLLCKDILEYKDGDRSNFTNHLKNFHKARFHNNLILAITFFDNDNLNNIIGQFERTADALTFSASDEILLRDGEDDAEDNEDLQVVNDVDEPFDDSGENDDGYKSFEVLGENYVGNESFNVAEENDDANKSFDVIDVAELTTKKKVLNCEHCDKTFSNKAALNKHTSKNHQHGEKRKEADDDENLVEPNSAKVPKLIAESNASLDDVSKATESNDSSGEVPKSSSESNGAATINTKPAADGIKTVEYDFIISTSDYFRKHPKQITSKTNISLHSMGVFLQVDPELPSGWKTREHTRPDGNTEKHYLSPDGRVIKSKYGAFEYIEVLNKSVAEQTKNIGEDEEGDAQEAETGEENVPDEGTKDKSLPRYRESKNQLKKDEKSSIENTKEDISRAQTKNQKKPGLGKECPECFKFVRNMKTHIEDKHSPPGHFPCPRKGCGKVYTSRNKVSSHFSRNCKNKK